MRSLRCFLLVFIVLPAAATAQGANQALRNQVREFVKAYIDAQNRVDASALVDMISRKPGVSAITMGEIVRGWEAIRADVDSAVGSEGQMKISLGSIDVESLGPNFALAFAPCTLTVHTAVGDIQLRGAVTLVLEKTTGKWKVLHDHSSAQLPELEGE